MTAAEVRTILDTADSMFEISTREVKKVPILRGKTIINLFFEPSTRTRSSFELAAKRLSADIINFSKQSSAVMKGEGLKDTVLNLEAMNPDVIIIRHSAAGAAYFISTFCQSHVINAGDGAHEHPTQALLDAFTIRQRKNFFMSSLREKNRCLTESRILVFRQGSREKVPIFFYDVGKRNLGFSWPTTGTRYCTSTHRSLAVSGQYLTIEQEEESQ